MLYILLTLAIIVFFACVTFLIIYAGRFSSLTTIKKLTAYDDSYNLYSMKIKYSYDLDKILRGDIKEEQDYIDAIVKEALPFLPVKIKVPYLGCSAFRTRTEETEWLMGRNYDFRYDTSAMMIACHPKKGYASISIAALNNIDADVAEKNLKTKISCLLSPFMILDGINEKGVSMAVLTLDSEPTRQNNGKPDLPTTLAIRLVLDRAGSTKEAIKLLRQYDMYATSGRDYHFYIMDASGYGVVIEYDPCSKSRKMVITEMDAITNFYGMYADRVKSNTRNGIFGHGKERYDSIMQVLDSADSVTVDTAWKALMASSQLPNPEDVTSNTQWSIVYSNTKKSASIVLRRHWEDVTHFNI